MFGLGMPEILMILAIALIVIGPKKLPDLAKTLGRAMGEFKRSAQDFKRSIDVETTVKDIKDVVDPKVDLEGIIKDANAGQAGAATPADDPRPETPDKDNPADTGDETPKGKEPDPVDNTSKNNKTDTP